jgi:ribosomal protein L3
MFVKTPKLLEVTNKGQRDVIVQILAKQTNPISADDLAKKVDACGKYNGKGTKGHVNRWAMEKAGGTLGSVRYHLRHLIEEGRVKEVADAPKKARKAKAEKPAEAAADLAQQQEQIAEDARDAA